MRFTRREFVRTAAGSALALAFASRFSLASNPAQTPLHGLSSFGDLKYPAGFRQFDYASPDAPTGGTFNFSPSNWGFNQNTQTFNTLNSFVLQGEAPPRMELCFDTLMAEAWDEPDALYGLLAETVTISADRNSYRFVLRSQARFHDGSPVTAHDVAWSVMTLKEDGHPQLALDLINVSQAVAIDDRTVEIAFNGKQSDRVILAIASTLPVFSRAWFADRKIVDVTLEVILSSGRYEVRDFSAGQYIAYGRVADYWGTDLPVSRGIDHFDEVRIEFFRERQAAFEAFKKGNIAWREEFTAKTWATEYDFPARREGKVRLAEFPEERIPSMQAFAVNTRRAKFAHPATRQAIARLFDFEWTNRNLFHDSYVRSNSLFEGSDFKASGTPGPAELAILEPLRDLLDPAVFGEAIVQPPSDGTGRDRRMLREADRLFALAGWSKRDGRMVNEAGEQLSIEFLIDSQVFERILAPYGENLRIMGVAVALRQVDPSQYQSRIEAHDFDIMMVAYNFQANPTGESLRQFFHSSSANRNGAKNHAGIADPGIDALVEKAAQAGSRAELVAAIRALDRALRAGQYWIPNWRAATHRVACWDMFGWKDPKPDYDFPVERLWWVDETRAKAIGRA